MTAPAAPPAQFASAVQPLLSGADSASVRVFAPAKINLALTVGPRPAGASFHPLASVMASVSWADELHMHVCRGPGTTAVAAPDVPDGDTLVTRAVGEFLQRAELQADVRVSIDKRVPVGAGLGGGSSDAGTALRTLNRLFGEPLSALALCETAAAVGSDVPFFALGGYPAVVRGRGELVRMVDWVSERRFTILWPAEHQPTTAVYGRYVPARDELPDDCELQELALAATGTNDLTDAALVGSPRLARVFELLHARGAKPLLCGSGSAVAVPEPDEAVRRLLDELAVAFPGARVADVQTL